jgi:hypothetical protein
LQGLGVGLGLPVTARHSAIERRVTIVGDVLSFTTECKTGPLGQGSVGTGSTAASLPSGPAPVANIIVQNAAVTASKVGPGEKVDVTASVTNRGTANGDAKITLYVNGQVAETQGLTLSSGQTAPIHFSVSRNEPGTYSVYVGGVPAGSFTVDMFTNNDIPIYGTIALVTIGIAGVLYLVTRRRTA